MLSAILFTDSGTQYVISTLSLALPSLTLNGLDPSPTVLQERTACLAADTATVPSPQLPDTAGGNYEQYDSRLGDRLRTLYAQFEDESTKVAELRREAPGAAAMAYQEALENEMNRQMKSTESKTEDTSEGDLSLAGWTLGRGLVRNQGVSMTWGNAVGKFTELGRLPGVLAVLERAERAIGTAGAS